MPYALANNRKEFEDIFPADFIAEGIDQTRGWLYLIKSPVVRAENLRFKEEGVRDVLKDVFLPWYNAYRFLVQNVQRLHKYNQCLLAASRLYTVVPKLVKFVDTLTNWYVRTNRRRLKGERGTEDCLWALETLFRVLFNMCRLMGSSSPSQAPPLPRLPSPPQAPFTSPGSLHLPRLPSPPQAPSFTSPGSLHLPRLPSPPQAPFFTSPGSLLHLPSLPSPPQAPFTSPGSLLHFPRLPSPPQAPFFTAPGSLLHLPRLPSPPQAPFFTAPGSLLHLPRLPSPTQAPLTSPGSLLHLPRLPPSPPQAPFFTSPGSLHLPRLPPSPPQAPFSPSPGSLHLPRLPSFSSPLL
ncbi:unnamed protein product [Coregonus sp. 'balchen']|nr:unnamed protein product [Coregonus sp. 'balchen']